MKSKMFYLCTMVVFFLTLSAYSHAQTAPVMSSISGITRLAPGSSVTYTASTVTSGDYEYIWRIPKKGFEYLVQDNTVFITYSLSGFYTIYCKVRDRNTGLESAEVSISIEVNSGYPLY